MAFRFFYASSACIYPEFKQLETNVSLESDAWPAEVSRSKIQYLGTISQLLSNLLKCYNLYIVASAIASGCLWLGEARD